MITGKKNGKAFISKFISDTRNATEHKAYKQISFTYFILGLFAALVFLRASACHVLIQLLYFFHNGNLLFYKQDIG